MGYKTVQMTAGRRIIKIVSTTAGICLVVYLAFYVGAMAAGQGPDFRWISSTFMFVLVVLYGLHGFVTRYDRDQTDRREPVIPEEPVIPGVSVIRYPPNVYPIHPPTGPRHRVDPTQIPCADWRGIEQTEAIEPATTARPVVRPFDPLHEDSGSWPPVWGPQAT